MSLTKPAGGHIGTVYGPTGTCACSHTHLNHCYTNGRRGGCYVYEFKGTDRLVEEEA